jgi:hypothetical protein
VNTARQRIRTYKPPPNEAQGGDTEHCRQAPLDVPPESLLTPPGYLPDDGLFKTLPLGIIAPGETSVCFYCSENLNADDDGQRTSTRTFAHSSCAWRVNDDFFARLDEKEAQTRQNPALPTLGFV